VEILFVQDYFRGIQIHTWSLGVEEQFYFFFATLMLALVYYGRIHALPWLFGIVALFALSGRTLLNLIQGFNQWGVLLPAHWRMDSLFFGVLISYFYWFRKDEFDRVSRKWWILPSAIVCLAPWLLLDVDRSLWMVTIGLSLNYLGFGLLLMWALQKRMPRWLTPLAFIGEYSYSIYLWHVAVRDWILDRVGLGSPTWQHFLIYIGFAIAWGMLLARIVEFPVLRLRDRITPPLTRS
jgi:peptidoglycan/LPS O-acetylase OafA/YrhL